MHGGVRAGAGRKRGSMNRASAEAMAMANEGGESPLACMLRVMRDEDASDARRDDMAKAAAPYCHHRLAAIEVSGADGGPIENQIASAKKTLARKLARYLGDSNSGTERVIARDGWTLAAAPTPERQAKYPK